MTHRNLCILAAKYLRRQGIVPFNRCQYVVCELERSNAESPDAFGLCSNTTQLIEVKVSRSDFLADKKKWFRQSPESGLGTHRSYMCPCGIIKESDLPKHWGLLYVNDDFSISIIKQPERQESCRKAETSLIMSILRREGINPQIFSYKNYKNEPTETEL